MKKIAGAVARSKTLGEAVGVVREAQQEELRRWKQELLGEALEEFVEVHLGKRWRPRSGPTPWVCAKCGPREGQQIKRNGHYRRGLTVLEGFITLRVPQLRCAGCGRSISLGAPFLPGRRRFWGDLDRRITEAYLGGTSYRQVKALVERGMNRDVGLMSLWRRFQEQAKQAKRGAGAGLLVTVYLDEVYLRVKGKPWWGLLALGETPSGSRHYLGASLARERSREAWERFVEGLGLAEGGRGIRVVHDGDQAIAGAVALVLPWAEERRCVWHEMQNLIRRARDSYPQNQLHQQQVIQDGIRALRAQWPPPPRTTSLMERSIKELRRRIRPMDGFGSLEGARHFLKAWMAKENTRAQGRDWLDAFVA